jgi:hypothetical protein
MVNISSNNSQEEREQREQAQREQAQREQAQREQAQREQEQREQEQLEQEQLEQEQGERQRPQIEINFARWEDNMWKQMPSLSVDLEKPSIVKETAYMMQKVRPFKQNWNEGV